MFTRHLTPANNARVSTTAGVWRWRGGQQGMGRLAALPHPERWRR